MSLVCEVPGCDNDLTPGCGSQGGPMLCKQCYSSQFYWKKKPFAAIEHRRWQLSRFLGRFDHFGTYMGNFHERQRKKAKNIKSRIRKKVRR